MSTKISQKEYLKKYLSGGSDKKKKKKDKKSRSRSSTVKIIDDDVHGDNNLDIDEELLLTGEDAPQIVGIIEGNGTNGESKWKSIGGIKSEEKPEIRENENDLWGKKATSRALERSPIRHKSLDRKTTIPERFPSKRAIDVVPQRRNLGQSPPRKRPVGHFNPFADPSPNIRRSPGNMRINSDQSPPRRHSQGRMRKISDQSPPRKHSQGRMGKNSDQSPPRRRSPFYSKRDSDQSPPRRQSQGRMRNNSDQSPPRRRSPGRMRNLDQSPPRRRSPGGYPSRDSEQFPPKRYSPGRMRGNSDQSPPRKGNPGRFGRQFDRPPPQGHLRHGSDFSPVRIKREASSDQSPPRRRINGNPFRAPIKMENPFLDNSPRKNRPRQDFDQSPIRIKHERHSESPPPTHKASAKMTKTLDGKRAGLQDAKTLKFETEARRRNEDRMFSKMSTEISGRDAEVQVRQSSSYRRRRKDLEEDPEVQRKKAAHEQQKKELYDRWNRGLKQIEAFKAKVSDDHYESSKPLARYSNDADLDEMLKQKERDDDPMLAYIRNKKKEQQRAANIPVIPKYIGSFPENRFGIPPGYRWDGVDRSNGYERKYFDMQNQKKALADEAYKYSTEDM